jgi:hypothetical protein
MKDLYAKLGLLIRYANLRKMLEIDLDFEKTLDLKGFDWKPSLAQLL